MPLTNDFNRSRSEPAFRFEKASGVSGVSASYRIPDSLSALAFENLYIAKDGVKPGILKDHNLPPSAWRVLDVHAKPEEFSLLFVDMLRGGWQKLAALNPSLADVRPDEDDAAALAHALIGATSGYNADDINFYLGLKWNSDEAGEPTGIANLPTGYEARVERIEAAFKTTLDWYPAPATLEIIERQLPARKAPKPPSNQLK